jgi:IclR family acetate operon transcriptional repressor
MAMQSVLRSLLVLEAVAEHQPVRVGELTPLLGLPKSTVQRSLETLAEAGWLHQVDGDLTRWALTSRARSVVLRSGGEEDLRETALRPMQQLRDAAGETAHLFVPAGSYRVVAIERVDSRRNVRTIIPLGTVFPMVASSAGIAMLARGPDEQVEAAIAEAALDADAPTGEDLERAREQVAAVHVKGYSSRVGWDRDVMGIGAAIMNYRGEAAAGVSIAIPLSRFQYSSEADWGKEVLEAAAAISRSLGYSGGDQPPAGPLSVPDV